MMPVTASIAAVWTPTAAKASVNGPEAGSACDALLPVQSGIKAGASIKPAPCALDIMKDQSARPICPAGARGSLALRAAKRYTAPTTSKPPAITCGKTRFSDRPSATAQATIAMDATWPTAIGASARKACIRSRDRSPQAAASIQPVAGFAPCRAPTPAIASHGHRFDMIDVPARSGSHVSGLSTAA
jgi:hypothetical protein